MTLNRPFIIVYCCRVISSQKSRVNSLFSFLIFPPVSHLGNVTEKELAFQLREKNISALLYVVLHVYKYMQVRVQYVVLKNTLSETRILGTEFFGVEKTEGIEEQDHLERGTHTNCYITALYEHLSVLYCMRCTVQ